MDFDEESAVLQSNDNDLYEDVEESEEAEPEMLIL